MAEEQVVPVGTDPTQVGAEPVGAGDGKSYKESFVQKILTEKKNVEARLRAFEEEKRKAEEAKMAEDGRLKELLQAKEQQIAELSVLKDEIEGYRAVEAKRKEALLEKFPESERDLFSGLSSAQLEVLVSKLAPAEEPTGAARPAGAKPAGDFDSMDNAEKLKLKLENPSVYRAKYNEWYKKKTGRLPQFDPISR